MNQPILWKYVIMVDYSFFQIFQIFNNPSNWLVFQYSKQSVITEHFAGLCFQNGKNSSCETARGCNNQWRGGRRRQLSAILARFAEQTSIHYISIINPLTTMSDQDRISLYNIITISGRQVIIIEKNINWVLFANVISTSPK